jgi:alcohol dehydrogenase class IV
VQPNPLASGVRLGADLAEQSGCDVIIGLGGGSAMDTAKGIAFLAGKEGDIFDYITGRRTGTTALPIICITTTAGTGSEGNATAVFTSDETLDKKGSGESPDLSEGLLRGFGFHGHPAQGADRRPRLRCAVPCL